MSRPASERPAGEQPAREQAAIQQAAEERPAGGQATRQRSGRQSILRRLCSTVLVFEAIVIGLAIPVAMTIEHLRGNVAGAVGGGMVAAAVILAGAAGRARWGLIAGSALQVLIIASGFVVPMMYALGVIFAAFWAAAIWLAYRLVPELHYLPGFSSARVFRGRPERFAQQGFTSARQPVASSRNRRSPASLVSTTS